MSEPLTVITEQFPIPVELISPGSRPKGRLYRTVKIVVAGAYLAAAGTVQVNLGPVAIPISLPAADPGGTYILTLYDNVMPMQIDQFELSTPLKGGQISVFLAGFV